jgi:hypothetical protein
MDKSKQKKEIVWNTEAISILSKRWSFGKRYIKDQINGNRNPLSADDIKKEYALLCRNLEAMEKTKKLNTL